MRKRPISPTDARKLAHWRTRQGWSQREAAKQRGVHHKTLADWEAGRRGIPLTVKRSLLV